MTPNSKNIRHELEEMRRQLQIAQYELRLEKEHGVSRQQKLNSLHSEKLELKSKLENAEKEIRRRKKRYNALLQSRSWKLTAPVRKSGRALRKVVAGVRGGSNSSSQSDNKEEDPIKLLRSIKPENKRELKSEYKRKQLHKAADTFALYRIIGNDLYPRHKKGQSRENLRLILEHEPDLEDCTKIFVVNRIIDKREELAIIKLLNSYNKEYIHIPFVPEEYISIGLDTDSLPEPGYLASKSYSTLSADNRSNVLAAVYRLKNNYIMNNNGARNVALRDGKKRAKWVLPWDGNCFVTSDAWKRIRANVTKASHLKYFAVPMSRVLSNDDLISGRKVPVPVEEPQIIFRKDSKEVFNIDFYYGRRPKVELFWRLGIPGKWDRWPDEEWDQKRRPPSTEARQFGVAGWVARMFSGAKELEQDNHLSFKRRGVARNEAIIATIRYADERFANKLSDEMVCYRLSKLNEERENYKQKKDARLSSVIVKLIQEADDALTRKPYSVTDKTTLPPSGDPHDYWHPAPYWWPNPDTPDGLPYVFRDGERVPGTQMYEPESEKYDRTRLQRMFDDSITLALAWKLTDKKKYATHAARILEKFFVKPSTRMNPHLNYAQVRMGHNENVGPGTGIIEMKDLYYYLDAVHILTDSGALSHEVLEEFKKWLAQYLKWLVSSPQGEKERVARNNHSTFYDLQIASIAEYLGEKKVLHEVVTRAHSRIRQQFAGDGSQPEELVRTTSAHYASFNLYAWILLARIAKRWGVDYWEYESKNHASLRRGAEWLLSFAGKSWPYEQINDFDQERFNVLAQKLPMRVSDEIVLPRVLTKPAYEIRPKFPPHSGVEPFWNLG